MDTHKHYSSPNEQWLFREATDPWVLESNNINATFPYAFIGNGYIGQRISPEGSGLTTQELLVPSGCQMHGVYQHQPMKGYVLEYAKKYFPKDKSLTQDLLLTLPAWNILTYNDGTADFNRKTGQHEAYRQRLELKTATIYTEDTWSSSTTKTTKISSNCYLSYVTRNLAVLTTTITPSFSGKVSFTDSIDGSFLTKISDLTCKEINGTNILELNSSDFGKLVIASRAIISPNSESHIETQQENKKITRKITLNVTANQKYTITKSVAIFSYQDGENLVAQACQLLQNLNLEHQYKLHKQTWNDLWQHRIEINGAPGLQQLLNASLYQFYSQLRPDIHWSLGPTGISGCSRWSGIIFWDADLWMGPTIALLNPQLAKSIFQYRYNTLTGAKMNAQNNGHQGARYAWESTLTGEETCFGYTAKQDHIVSDVALTQWQYCLLSGDNDYYQKATEIILECAKFWESRVQYNQEQERFEIMQVCCADEKSGIVDNNTLTNYGAIKTFELAQKVMNTAIPTKWEEICHKIYLPYDEERDLYLEHANYQGEVIKQADTALLVYPYAMPLSVIQQTNIIEYYSNKYPTPKIMMSSAFDGIAHCKIMDPTKAWESLLELLPHFTKPFLLAAESPANHVFSFLTGIGGLLQLIINGLAGMSIKDDGLEFKPCLPPQIPQITLKGIHYNGINFDATITNAEVKTENFSSKPTFNIYSQEF